MLRPRHSDPLVGVLVLVLVAACGDEPGPGEGDGRCTEHAQCDDGVFCNGAETCDPDAVTATPLGCVLGLPPCLAGQRCDEGTSSCEALCEVERDADGDGDDAIACGGTDCDDTNDAVFGGATELCDSLSLDEDCRPTTFGERDRDRDGFTHAGCCNGTACGQDCNDARPGVHPLATEACNGIDDDCDGDVDEGVSVEGFRDGDGDGFGDGTVIGCAGVGGFALEGGDCDDADPDAHPDQPEATDGTDNDCDGYTDEASGNTVWYADTDGDGYGDPLGATTIAPERPSEGAWTLNALDCDDGDPAVYPAAAELCNAVDDDCDGVLDGGSATDWEDDDGDGVADASCGGTDCDDADPFAAPGNPERCNGRDDDCDGTVDEAVSEGTYYTDADGDGFGAGAPVMSCDASSTLVPRAGDCDDTDPFTYPGASERCDLAVQDCTSTYLDEGAVCVIPGATAICSTGDCIVSACPTGRADCDGRSFNGCEADLFADPARCGVCDAACNPGDTCDRGVCSTGWVRQTSITGSIGSDRPMGRVGYLSSDPPITAVPNPPDGTFSMVVPGRVDGSDTLLVEAANIWPTRYPLQAPSTATPVTLTEAEVAAIEAANPAMPPQRADLGMVLVYWLGNSGVYDHRLTSGGTSETWRGFHAGDTDVTVFFNVAPGFFSIEPDSRCFFYAAESRVQRGTASIVKVQCP